MQNNNQKTTENNVKRLQFDEDALKQLPTFHETTASRSGCVNKFYFQVGILVFKVEGDSMANYSNEYFAKRSTPAGANIVTDSRPISKVNYQKFVGKDVIAMFKDNTFMFATVLEVSDLITEFSFLNPDKEQFQDTSLFNDAFILREIKQITIPVK